MDTTQFLMVTVVGLLAVVSPGPDFLIVCRNSVSYSRRIGLYTSLGIFLGTVWWVAASLAGISLIISKTVLIFNMMKWLGAAYLIYIGIQSFRSKKNHLRSTENGGSSRCKMISPWEAFRTGHLTNLLNPKAAMFFVSFFSVVITPETPTVTRTFYGLELSLIALAWFSLLSTVLSVSLVKSFFNRTSEWFEKLTGAVLIALGLKLALSKAD